MVEGKKEVKKMKKVKVLDIQVGGSLMLVLLLLSLELFASFYLLEILLYPLHLPIYLFSHSPYIGILL